MNRFCFASALVLVLVVVSPAMPEAITLDEAIKMALAEGEDARIAGQKALMVN